MDPLFDDYVSGGGNRIDPPRELNRPAITADLDAVIVSHHHSDHFSPVDLALIPQLDRVPVLIPDDTRLETQFRKLGATDIRRMQVWESVTIGGVTVTATPSAVDFPEIGMAFRGGDELLLNLVDSVFHAYAEEIRDRLGRPDLALAPFQAGGYMSYLPLRSGGPPSGLVDAIRNWSEEELAGLVHALRVLEPRHVASFADGICYTDKSINAWHFPLPEQRFLESVSSSGVPVSTARPGVQFRFLNGQVIVAENQTNLVRLRGQPADRKFSPGDVIPDIPISWWESADPRLAAKLEPIPFPTAVEIIRDGLVRCYQRIVGLLDYDFVGRLNAWELVLLHPEKNPRESLAISFDDAGSVLSAPEPTRPYGIVCHAGDLALVVGGSLPLEALVLGGHFRYRSPALDVDLESLRHRTIKVLEKILRTE